MLPAVTGPGFMASFARAGNGPEAPGAAPGVDVEGRKITAVRGIAPCHADDDFVFDDQWRAGYITAALAHIFDVYPPQLAAGLLIERDDA